MPQIKTRLIDIEPKQDKNRNSFYKLTLSNLGEPFYAFATDYNLKEATLRLLKESPEKLVNQLVLITYEEVPNKEREGTFKKVREIELLP